IFHQAQPSDNNVTDFNRACIRRDMLPLCNQFFAKEERREHDLFAQSRVLSNQQSRHEVCRLIGVGPRVTATGAESFGRISDRKQSKSEGAIAWPRPLSKTLWCLFLMIGRRPSAR